MLEKTYTLSLSNCLLLLIAITPFSRALSINLGFAVIDLFAYSLFIILFFFLRFTMKHFLMVASFMAFFIVYNFTGFLISDSNWGNYFKQIIPFVFIYTILGLYLNINKIGMLMNLYSKVAFVVALIGVFQVLIYLFLGMSLFMDSPPRANSVVYEASHLGIVIMPALFYLYIINKNRLFSGQYRYKILTILTCCILTLSATVFAVLLLGFAIIYVLNRGISILKLSVLFVFVSIFMFFIPQNVYLEIDEMLKGRISDTIEVYSSGDFGGVNRSTFSLMSNISIAKESLQSSYLIGSGIGGHESTASKFYVVNTEFEHREINSKSGHSLIIRLTSEMGLLGLGVLLLVIFNSLRIYNYFLKVNNFEGAAISISIFIYLLGRCFKLGGYFDYGTPMFFVVSFLLIFNYRLYLRSDT